MAEWERAISNWSIKHTHVEDVKNNVKAECQRHSFANLTSILIFENYDNPSDRDPEVIKWLSKSGTPGQLLFPMLWTLDLSAADMNGANVIRHSHFPKLETAYVYLETREDMTTHDGNSS